MPNDNYKRGRNFEYYVLKKLQDKGFYAMRSAGSHTVIDLLAFKEDEMLLLQLKSSSKDKEPDIKQLLKPTVIVKENSIASIHQSNVKILEELKVPLIANEKVFYHEAPVPLLPNKPARKIILWKGTGRNNIYHFEYLNNRWVNVLNHLFKEIKGVSK